MTEKNSAQEIEELLWGAARKDRPSSGALRRATVAVGVTGAGALLSGKAFAFLSGGAGKLSLAGVFAALGALVWFGAVASKNEQTPGAPHEGRSPVEHRGNPASEGKLAIHEQAALPAPAELKPDASASESSLNNQNPVAPQISNSAPSAHLARLSEGLSPKRDVVQRKNSESAETLSKEILLVDRVRQALAKGQTQEVLRLCQHYHRTYPGGRLSPEIVALQKRAMK